MDSRKITMYLSVSVLLFVFVTICNAVEFDVMPGGQKHTMKESLGKVVCEFSYVCQGGTNEKWSIEVTHDGSGTHVCKIHRPDGKSYLYFQDFELKVEGARIQKDVTVIKNDLKEVGEEEILIDTNANKVSKSKKFKAELTGIEVRMITAKEDL